MGRKCIRACVCVCMHVCVYACIYACLRLMKNVYVYLCMIMEEKKNEGRSM